MRLTLRTLLAYLDDTLEPDQAKLIGQKIAESEQARDIIKLIQQVTRRRRITTPPDGGPGGKLDANTLGEYLDNEISSEQAAEVEEICLTSDTHLAEIAACHQILTLIVGEPALAPPSAYQRMYGLVKGPESIPFRKPAPVVIRANHEVAEGRDVDDTLRLGLAPVIGTNRSSPWLLIAGGLAAVCLLVLAVWQIVKEPGESASTQVNMPIVQISPAKGKSPSGQDKTDQGEGKKEQSGGKKEQGEDKKLVDVEPPPVKKDEQKELPEVKLPPAPLDLPLTPPSAAVQPAGKLVVDVKEPALLLHWHADKNEWQSVAGKNPVIFTGQPLVSLPSSKCVIDLAKGLKLMLVGAMPELYFPPPPLYECAIELHAHDKLDLDVTLRRGRIRVATPDHPARIRIRFDNPTQPNQKEHFDITLPFAGSEVLIERWLIWPRNERFHKDPTAPDRKGPVAEMALFVLAGSALVKHNDVSHSLTTPPGNVQLYWNSLKGLDQPLSFPALPEGLMSLSPLPPKTDARFRTDLLRARDDLQQRLWANAIDVALADGCKSANPALRRLACCSLAAIDDFAGLIEQLDQERTADLRATAIEALRQWIVAGRDNEYKVYELLTKKYKAADAHAIMRYLHDLSEKDLMNPETYDLLINQLDHPQLVVRELASWHLNAQAPAGRKIRYNASADAATRRQAQAQWRALIPMNELPPMPKMK